MKSATAFFDSTRTANRVLVIDPGMLGDTVHLLPALWELRRSYPKAELHVLCSPVGAEVLVMSGCADKLWILEQAHKRRTLAAQLRILAALRRLRFDVSINFGGNDRTLIYAGLIGARWRLGIRWSRWHFWSSWCITYWVVLQCHDVPVFEHRRQALAAAGLPLAEPRFGLKCDEAARRWAVENVPAGAIHISINAASTPLNEWPLDHWVELVQLLLKEGASTAIIATGSGSSQEQKRLDELRSRVRDERLRVFSERLTLSQLSALLTRCGTHIGSDSGVLHLAVALGVRTFSFFRERGSSAWVPRGAEHRAFRQPCKCHLHPDKPPCPDVRPACLDSLSPVTVAEAVLGKPCAPLAAAERRRLVAPPPLPK